MLRNFSCCASKVLGENSLESRGEPQRISQVEDHDCFSPKDLGLAVVSGDNLCNFQFAGTHVEASKLPTWFVSDSDLAVFASADGHSIVLSSHDTPE